MAVRRMQTKARPEWQVDGGDPPRGANEGFGNSGSPLNGTASPDILLAFDSGLINGLGGDDLILGDADLVFQANPGNNSQANAASLDIDIFWSLKENPLVSNSTSVPHLTAFIDAEPNSMDYFKIDLVAGQTITIDIDAAGGALGSADNTNTTLTLVTPNTQIVGNDGTLSAGGEGSISFGDSYLSHTALVTGTYYIRLGETAGPSPDTVLFDGDEQFLMNVSVTGHAVTDLQAGPFNDTIEGGSGQDHLLGGQGDDLIRGGDDDDRIDGGSGNDFLDGGSGTDLLRGGAGDDTYVVNGQDVIGGEFVNFGSDIVYATTSYTLPSSMELEVLTVQNYGGTTPLSLTGNEFANEIVGNAGNDVLDGGGGVDELFGREGNDTFVVDDAADEVGEFNGEGNDIVLTSVSYQLPAVIGSFERLATTNQAGTAAINLTGNAFAQTMVGNAGSNIFNPAGGGDTMSGLGGNDFYLVWTPSDLVLESVGGGSDTIYALVGYALPAGQEIEVLDVFDRSATAAFSLTGNAFAQTIVGNAGANTLNGAGGTDIMYGLGGNDSYLVWTAADLVVEGAGQGSDTVYALVSYALAAGQEIEVLDSFDRSATTALSLTGNAFAQTIVGNAGANRLSGAGGTDIMYGLGGNDSYLVWTATDLVVEGAGQGSDTVLALVSYALAAGQEIEVLDSFDRGATTALNLTGNAAAQTIIGNAGANVLTGAGGADILYGLGGADSFALIAAPAAGNASVIVDFTTGADKIALDDAVFAGIGGPGALAAGRFATGTPTDVDDRIVYNAATGQLFYDGDGSGAGAAVLVATLLGAPALTTSDFQVI